MCFWVRVRPWRLKALSDPVASSQLLALLRPPALPFLTTTSIELGNCLHGDSLVRVLCTVVYSA